MELRGRTVLLTGATGGLGHAIARGVAARGATLILTGRRMDVLEPLAAETGGRAMVCDLGDPARPRAPARRGRRHRRPDRQRRAPRQRARHELLRGGDRPRAGRQPARADDPRPPARRADGGARRGPHGVRLLFGREDREPRRRRLLGDQVRPARLRPRAPGGPPRPWCRGVRGRPRFHPRGRHVPRRGRDPPPLRRHQDARRRRRRGRDGDRARPRRGRRRAAGHARRRRASAASPPGSPHRSSAAWAPTRSRPTWAAASATSAASARRAPVRGRPPA